MHPHPTQNHTTDTDIHFIRVLLDRNDFQQTLVIVPW